MDTASFTLDSKVERSSLIKHLRKHGCYLKREGAGHSLRCNPETGAVESVPRHTEISNLLTRRILRNLAVPEVGQEK